MGAELVDLVVHVDTGRWSATVVDSVHLVVPDGATRFPAEKLELHPHQMSGGEAKRAACVRTPMPVARCSR